MAGNYCQKHTLEGINQNRVMSNFTVVQELWRKDIECDINKCKDYAIWHVE